MAKTTTVHSLGAALAARGRRVLLVDLDPQACLTFSTGIDPDKLERLAARRPGRPDRRPPKCWSRWADSILLPASIDLAGAEVHLLTKPGREYALDRALAPVVRRTST